MKNIIDVSLAAVHTHTHTDNSSEIKILADNKIQINNIYNKSYASKNYKIAGITLIALVITIVILIILAGISIGVIKNTGIIEKAKQAKDDTNYVVAAEKVALAINSSYDNSGNRSNELLKENINKINGLDKKIDNVTDNSYNIKIKVDGFKFEITKEWTINSEKNISDKNIKSGKNAEKLINDYGNSINELAGKEVKYIRYQDRNGQIQDKWIVAYIGKINDTSQDIVDDMPSNENHIYLLPKYSIKILRPASQIIVSSDKKEIAQSQIYEIGYRATSEFKDCMRDAENWMDYSINKNTKVHGAMSVTQYNTFTSWSGRSDYLKNGDAFWLDDPTWTNAIARVDGNGIRSGNGLSYWTDSLGIRPLVMLSSDCKISDDNEILFNSDMEYTKDEKNNEMTADQFIEYFSEKSWTASLLSLMAGKEVEYINYKNSNGEVKNKWIVAYIGKIQDTSQDIIDDMPNNENHIYLLPKDNLAYINPNGKQIKVLLVNKIIQSQIDNTLGYSSTANFKDIMRNANNWKNMAESYKTKVHGAMSINQYNTFVTWARNSQYLKNGGAFWLDDPTWTDAIARVDGDGNRSGNGLSYWTDSLGIRPLVMLKSDFKINNNIIY